MSERRTNNRLGIKLEVELKTEDQAQSLHTRDLSNSGVFLEKGESQLPPLDSIVYLRVKSQFDDGDAPLVKARVVRIDEHGIALTFLNE